jgi:hypothetical protein
MKDLGYELLQDTISTLHDWKEQGDKALAQIGDEDLLWSPDPESNSIAVIIQHLRGNLVSRWSDFLNEDGEKPTRNRDAEFIAPETIDQPSLIRLWEEGWSCIFDALHDLSPDDLLKAITIYGKERTVVLAIQCALAHTTVHVGQIVWIAKARRGDAWQPITIPRTR